MSIEGWTLVIAVVTAITCGLCGSLLVVSRQAMVSEGLSHAVLPGLVIAFIFTRSFSSPWLIAAAAASGLLMVWFSRLLARTQLIDADAGLGLVFASMFSLGVLLVGLNLKHTHFHADHIIDGNLALAPLGKIAVPWIGRVPQAMVSMSATLVATATFMVVAHKELKVMIFDPMHASQTGYRPVLLEYAWIALVSLTTVTAFEVAGAVLIVALMIAPAATAFLLTRRYGRFVCLSALIASACAVAGYYAGKRMDVSPTGPIASVAGLVFLLAFLLNPQSGVFARLLAGQSSIRHLRHCLSCEMIAGAEDTSRAVARLCHRLGYSETRSSQLVREVLSKGWLQQDAATQTLVLTPSGQQAIEAVAGKPN